MLFALSLLLQLAKEPRRRGARALGKCPALLFCYLWVHATAVLALCCIAVAVAVAIGVTSIVVLAVLLLPVLMPTLNLL